ncbi:MAG: FAD-linked oxidase C-terminal domain-containing protein [Ilumatobacteraceae bacterium]
MLAEFGGDTAAEADEQARGLMAALDDAGVTLGMRLLDDPEEEERLWLLRESGLGATASVAGRGDTWEGWEDAAVPPDRLGDYLREFKPLLERHGHETAALYGHFGDGCVHTRIDFNLRARDGIADYRAFAEEAADLVLRYGGSLSGEHGDGQSRAELLPRMFGDELVQAFREFKALWDPDGRMNPGKVVDPYRLDENLRLGPTYNPIPVTTHFRFPTDEGDFAKAALRCVGVGLCRRSEGGTMCPSYMVTRDEQHSTRGRARMLFEMLQGDVITGGWQDERVKDALDLCLSCKGCKSDCPVNVDMATYKAEFLSHYYEGHRRPRAAYAIGKIHRWAGIAAHVPRLANLGGALPGVRALAKRAAGVHLKRSLPKFATTTFRAAFTARPLSAATGPRVILWPDTFNDALQPRRPPCRRRRPGGGRLHRRHPPDAALLRATALRLRVPRRGQGAPTPHPRRARGRHPRGCTRRGSRAELRGRVPRRASQPVPPRPERRTAVPPDHGAQRVPRAPRPGLARPRAEGTAGRRARALPPPGDHGLRRRGAPPRPARPRRGSPGARLLRHGGLVRLRGRSLRCGHAGRRARPAPRRPGHRR